MLKKLIPLLLLASIANADQYYNQTTIPPKIPAYTILMNPTASTAAPAAATSPFRFGSSLSPTFLNSYTITGAVTANSATFTCATGCTSLRVGQGITGSDGVNLIFPSTAGQLGTLITNVGTGINGATITVSIATNVLTTPGTYTLTIGKDRWSTTSTAMVNSLGTTNIWAGNAAQGNSTWAQGYLSGDCDTGAKVTNCFLMNSGASSQINNFWGARTSDNTASGAVEANVSLVVNDDAVNSKAMWNHYWETINLTGAGTTNQGRALESTIYNYNAVSGALKPDPFAVNKNGGTENIRLSVGQSGVGTLYNTMDAISIVGIGGAVFETGILFDSTSLDQSTTTHPPAVALPSGANGYGVTWYEATGYTTPSWNLYATNTTNSGNLFALNDSDVIVTIPNDLGTGLVTLGSGALKLSGNHTGTLSGEGAGFGLDVSSATINDPVSSGAVTVGAISHFGVATLTSTSPVTIATAATVTITGCPVASTNVTITTCNALRVFGDESRFDGTVKAAGGLTAFGADSSINASSNFNSNINTGSSTGTVTLGQNTATPSAVAIKGPFSFQAGTAFTGASWTTTSPVFNGTAMTLNDTTASGTVTTEAAYSLQAPTFTSTGGASTTITNASSLWLAAPTCSGGVVCTNFFSLFAAGKINAAAGLNVTGGVINLNASSNAAVNIATGTHNTTTTIGGTTAGNNVNLASVSTRFGNVLYASVTAPTIASGFNTSSFSITAASTAAFQVTVGTSTGTTTGVVTMPAATTGWACSVADVTTPATNMVQQTGSTTTSVTVTNFVRTTGVAGNFTNSDKLVFVCGAF